MQFAHACNRILTREHHRHERRGGHERRELAVERLFEMLRIVDACDAIRHLHHLHRTDLEPRILVCLRNVSDVVRPDGVRLNENQSLFHYFISSMICLYSAPRPA